MVTKHPEIRFKGPIKAFVEVYPPLSHLPFYLSSPRFPIFFSVFTLFSFPSHPAHSAKCLSYLDASCPSLRSSSFCVPASSIIFFCEFYFSSSLFFFFALSFPFYFVYFCCCSSLIALLLFFFFFTSIPFVLCLFCCSPFSLFLLFLFFSLLSICIRLSFPFLLVLVLPHVQISHQDPARRQTETDVSLTVKRGIAICLVG